MTSCFGCSDTRDTCGQAYSSSCVWYTGKLPAFIIAENKLCKANINDVFKEYGDKLDFLLTNSNVITLNRKTLTFDTANITPLALQQVFIDEISKLKTQVNDLTSKLVNLNIGDLQVNIDLGFMKPDGVSCETSPNTYPLQSLLNIIINRLNS